jgi:hypothetical protein
LAAVRTIALRLGERSTDLQQGRDFGADAGGRSTGADMRGRSAGADARGRSAGGDARRRSAGGVVQPTSVTIAIVAMMKRSRIGLIVR